MSEGVSVTRTATTMWCSSCRAVVNVNMEVERRLVENRRTTIHTCQHGHFMRSFEEPLFDQELTR